MTNKVFITIALTLIVLPVWAQKNIEERDMTWLGYFNQTRFTQHSGVWVDVHVRLNEDFVKETHALLARAAYLYYVTDKTRIAVGYAYQNQPGHEGASTVYEHRPWQQIQWFDKRSWYNMMQWIRLEQRYRKNGDADFHFNNPRIRYNMSFTIPLTKKEVVPKTPFLFFNDEIFINFGKNIVYNYFDQNRLFVGVGYQFTSHLNAHVGYMNVFQQLPAGDQYVNTGAIRLFVFHNLDFRTKE